MAGCNKEVANETSAPETTAAEQTNQAEETSEAAAEPTPVEYEPVTLSCWTAFSDKLEAQIMKTYADHEIFKKVMEDTKVTIEWLMPSQGQAQEQFNLMAVSNDLPDMIRYNIDKYYPGGVSAALKDELVIPLNDYMNDEYLPNYGRFLNAFPEFVKMIKTDDGQYYGIMGVLIKSPEGNFSTDLTEKELEYQCYTGLIVNKKWLDELSLDEPVTFDDWTEMLTAFKTEKGSEAPFTTVNSYMIRSNAFINMYDLCHYFFLDYQTNEVKYGPVEEGYLDYLTKMNGWYEAGLLDKDFAAIDNTGMLAKIINEESGAYAGYGSRVGMVYRDTRESNPDMNPVAVKSPVLTEGQKLIYNQRTYPANPVGAFITPECSDIPAALRFWDYLWSDEGAMLSQMGIEGLSYEYNSEGYPKFTDLLNNNPDGFDSNNASMKYLFKSGNPSPMAMEAVWEIQYAYGTDEAVKAPQIWSEYNGAYSEKLPPITMTEEEVSIYSSIYSDIDTYTDEMRTKFIMGVEPLANYDKFVEDIKAMGLQTIIDIQQAAVDRYFNR